MEVRSIGWRTELMVRRAEGAEIVERDDHLLIRTERNPTYRWGNFLLFDGPPDADDAQHWVEQFELDFPGAGYLAIGFDSPSGALGEIDGFLAAGIDVQVDAVLSAEHLQAAAREPPPAVFRELRGEEDWRLALELRLAVEEAGDDSEGSGYRDFLERQMRAIRAACRQGHGAWFGAFHEHRLLSGLGIFSAGPDTARFQSVETRPGHRGQGLATNLLLAAGEYAHRQLGAGSLVIAADPDYLAIDVYRSLGFRDREHHVQLERSGGRPR
jgi:GNAT superfamily N-acetyltransferase